jgi:beta-glucanase (GH16 family)
MRLSFKVIVFASVVLSACVNGSDVSNSGYKMVWNDEFDVNGLPDSNKWSYDTTANAWGWGNCELQWYTTNNTKNTYIKDGYLHIVAIKEKTGSRNFSSGRLITRDKAEWLYGRAEVRAKMPAARGTWPAIWMLPADSVYGGWPASGEIDIIEHVGYLPDSIYASTHCQSYYFKIGTQKTKGLYMPDCTQKFHTYVMEWSPEEISMYCDSIKYFNFKNEHKTYKEWPFDKSFYMILNLAVGGSWGGVQGVDSSAFPQEMVVDYVRIFQK